MLVEYKVVKCDPSPGVSIKTVLMLALVDKFPPAKPVPGLEVMAAVSYACGTTV